MNGQPANSLLYSALTFRRRLPEKAAFVVLNTLDLVLTLIAAATGLSELNPVMINLLQSPIWLIACKIVIPAFIAWSVPGRWLWPALAAISLIVGWNIKELLVFYL